MAAAMRLRPLEKDKFFDGAENHFAIFAEEQVHVGFGVGLSGRRSSRGRPRVRQAV
jgi:hypothetical protein